MRIFIEDVSALNPHVIRVMVAVRNDETYDPEKENAYNDYELAIPIDTFTENDGEGNVSINGDKLQQTISERVVAAQNAAILARFINNLSMEWDLVPREQTVREEKDDNGLTLAYGEKNELNTT